MWVGPAQHGWERLPVFSCCVGRALPVLAVCRLPIGAHQPHAIMPPPPLQVLCTVGDQQAALSEVLRVLKPGGRFIFLEHVAAPPGALLHRVQRVLNPAVRLVGHGCSATRCTLEAIQAAGFGSVEAESFRLDLWALSPAAVVSPHIAGTAVK